MKPRADEKSWKVLSVTTQPRLDGSGHAHQFMVIKYFIAGRGYTGTLYIPEASATPDAIKAAIQVDVDRIESVYAL